MSLRFHTFLEPLESRIAPAAVIHPLPDIVAGVGQTGAVVDLSKIFDSGTTGDYANHTLITIKTNFDIDPNQPGLQAGEITIELFDDLAPLTVQNFLRYALNKNANGDYDDTFFHRLAEGFVLQGGGFQFDGKNVEHIDSLSPVHNEFDPTRSNLRGTIALAKTESSPNTGTSEWFINLADNSGNLDNQNGGFTVFGRVIDKPGVVDGMEVIDKIAQLPTATGIVGSFPTPLQNYTPGVDTVTLDNLSTKLVKIQDIVVTPSSGSKPSGVTYSDIEVKMVGSDGVATAQSSDLLVATLDGAHLNLKYAPGKTGVAEVKIKVTDADGSHDEVFRVTVQPNLITSFAANNLPGALVPGDTGTVKLNITNTGGGLAKGQVDIKFYFAKVVLTNGEYKTVEPRVTLDAGIQTVPVTIASGGTVTVSAKVQVPTDLVEDQSTLYHLYAEVVPKEGSFNSAEINGYTDDNTTVEPGGRHQIFNAFGHVGSRNVPLTFKDSNGDIVTLQLKGKQGFGQITKNADGTLDLVINGTQANTQVRALVNSRTGDGEVSFRNIDALTPLASINFGQIDITGNVALSGGVKFLQLEDITGPSTMSIGMIPGAGNVKANLSFGRVKDLNFESTMKIGSLRATEWLDTGAQDSLRAPVLETLTIGTSKVIGNLEADVYVTSLASVKSFVVNGRVKDSTVQISGNVGTVRLGGIENSDFLVGTNTHPDSLADFTKFRSVGFFSITNAIGGADLFVNSTVAAATFGKVVIRGVDGDSSTDGFGIIANAIKSYNRVGFAVATNLNAPKTIDTNGQYRVQIL